MVPIVKQNKLPQTWTTCKGIGSILSNDFSKFWNCIYKFLDFSQWSKTTKAFKWCQSCFELKENELLDKYTKLLSDAYQDRPWNFDNKLYRVATWSGTLITETVTRLFTDVTVFSYLADECKPGWKWRCLIQTSQSAVHVQGLTSGKTLGPAGF